MNEDTNKQTNKQTIELTSEEALFIVKSLGTKAHRMEQSVRWKERKGIPFLRQDLASAITIGDKFNEERLRDKLNFKQSVRDWQVDMAKKMLNLCKRIVDEFGIEEKQPDTQLVLGGNHS